MVKVRRDCKWDAFLWPLQIRPYMYLINLCAIQYHDENSCYFTPVNYRYFVILFPIRSNIDEELVEYQNQYIRRYSQLIINGTISADPWSLSKNWLYVDPINANHVQTDWNNDSTTEIYRNCDFLDKLERDFGIYLKK